MWEKNALLTLWRAAGGPLAIFARWHLRRRVARGKEDPARVQEKLGVPALPRPEGRLIWLHAVGVGEVLALPSLIRAMHRHAPDLNYLVTSSSRTSAMAIARDLPHGALHQYLPLDALPLVRRFLDHWRPDAAIWAERDIWPAFVSEAARRGIPSAIINARMDAGSFRAKRRARRLFAALYSEMAFVSVQDSQTAAHFRALGVDGHRILVGGSLKAGADPLPDDPEARLRLERLLAGRRLWLAASTHEGEGRIVAEALTYFGDHIEEDLFRTADGELHQSLEAAQDHRRRLFDALRQDHSAHCVINGIRISADASETWEVIDLARADHTADLGVYDAFVCHDSLTGLNHRTATPEAAMAFHAGHGEVLDTIDRAEAAAKIERRITDESGEFGVWVEVQEP